MSVWEITAYPGVGMVLWLYSHVMLMAFAYTASVFLSTKFFTETDLISPVVPVFLFEPIKLGGIHLSPPQISVVLGAGGLFQALWLLIAFPRLQHRFGTVGVLRACSIVWPFFFTAFPLCNMFLRHQLRVPLWIVGSVALVVGSGVAMAYSKYSCLYPSTSRL
jgi:hypothetical protein